MIVAIVQARMSSSRLPGKVLLPLSNKPIIEHVIDQLSYSDKVDQTILATSIDPSDDPLIKWAEIRKVNWFRGDLNDVLDRYYNAALKYKADIIVRITADCPLIDPEIVDKIVEEFIDGEYSYVSNVNPPTFPDGLDVEVFSFKTLKVAWEKARLISEREHVTLYIRNHPEIFKISNYTNSINLNHYRWTLDQNEDYLFLQEVEKNVIRKTNYVRMIDILEYLNSNISLLEINKKIKRNEGLEKSLKKDKEI